MIKTRKLITTKEEKYQQINRQFNAILNSDLEPYVHFNNLCSLLKTEFHFFWVGFYVRKGANELVLGPYQGEVPCVKIKLGQGVCGTAAEKKLTQLVSDVHQFPGYIACHPEPNAEIVVPGIINDECTFVLDIDHIEKNYFDEVDKKYLEEFCQILIEKFY